MSRGVRFSETDTTTAILEQEQPYNRNPTKTTKTDCANRSSASNPNNIHGTLPLPLPQLLERDDSIFTPPGSPGGLNREPSVHHLYKSARRSFQGRLEPRRNPTALEYPVRKGYTRMVPAQEWDVRDVALPAGGVAGGGQTGGDAAIGVILDKTEATSAGGVGSAASAVQTPAANITVVASAPGKVILFGEHAVVYGKPAVAAAVSDLRIVVTARATEEATLSLELPDLKNVDGSPLSFSRSTEEVASYFAYTLAMARGATPSPPSQDHLALIANFLGDSCSPDSKKALLPLMFLTLALVPDVFLGSAGSTARGLSVTAFSSSLPVGAGLGSSAAFCVASSAALTRLTRLIKGQGRGLVDEKGGERRPGVPELEEINAWAYAGETVLHGTPSGLDNTVSCFGGAIKFTKGMDGAGNVTEPIPGFPPLSILLTNTLVPRETRALVGRVRILLEGHPDPTTAAFDAIGAVGTEFLDRAAASNAATTSASASAEQGGSLGKRLTAEGVGELAEINHHLLCALGVGHPALERVCAIASAYGCKSKLTGAGGGGCALTILGADLSDRKALLVRDLVAEGFKCYESALGGDGVLWHDGGVPSAFMLAAATTREELSKQRASDVGVRDGDRDGFAGRLRSVKGVGLNPAVSLAIAAVTVALGIVAVVVRQRSRRCYI